MLVIESSQIEHWIFCFERSEIYFSIFLTRIFLNFLYVFDMVFGHFK